jgi:hypothetical protein
MKITKAAAILLPLLSLSGGYAQSRKVSNKMSKRMLKSSKMLKGSKMPKNGSCDDDDDDVVLPPEIDCVPPPEIKAIGQDQQYCDLYENDPRQANLFHIVVQKALQFDPTFNFLVECLESLLLGAQYQQREMDIEEEIQNSCGQDDRNDTYVSRYVCKEDETKVNTFFGLEYNGASTSRRTPTIIPGDILICKPDSCQTDVLKNILKETFLDFDDIGTTDGAYRKENYTAVEAYIPTAECFYDQFQAPSDDPELYCSGDNAPVCNNTKLVDVDLGVDGSFEVAVCDDNDCIDSLGGVELADIAGGFAVGFGLYIGAQRNPFCYKAEFDPSTTPFMSRFVNATATYSDKVFNLADYCSVAAVSKRTGICDPKPTKAKKCKATKAPKKKKCKEKSSKNKKGKSSKV